LVLVGSLCQPLVYLSLSLFCSPPGRRGCRFVTFLLFRIRPGNFFPSLWRHGLVWFTLFRSRGNPGFFFHLLLGCDFPRLLQVLVSLSSFLHVLRFFLAVLYCDHILPRAVLSLLPAAWVGIAPRDVYSLFSRSGEEAFFFSFFSKVMLFTRSNQSFLPSHQWLVLSFFFSSFSSFPLLSATPPLFGSFFPQPGFFLFDVFCGFLLFRCLLFDSSCGRV